MIEDLNFSTRHLSQHLIDEHGLSPDNETLMKTEAALISYASEKGLPASDDLKASIIKKMSALNFQAKHRSPFTLDNLPMLTADSNFLDWEAAVSSIQPPADFEDIFMHILVSDDTRDLMLGWSKEIIPEEVHEDLVESFIVLEGSCECHIWQEKSPGEKRIIHMRTGDFLQLNIGESHDIITSSAIPVKAILQRLKVRA